jgi:DNA-directed RNA polymerase I, II, and III subunit RPABC1
LLELFSHTEREREREREMEGNGFEGDLNGEILGPCLSSYVDEGSTESHRYYLARRTVLEMLKDRGYAVPASEIELSIQDFRAIHGQTPDLERLRISTNLRSDPLKRVSIFGFLFIFSRVFV